MPTDATYVGSKTRDLTLGSVVQLPHECEVSLELTGQVFNACENQNNNACANFNNFYDSNTREKQYYSDLESTQININAFTSLKSYCLYMYTCKCCPNHNIRLFTSPACRHMLTLFRPH